MSETAIILTAFGTSTEARATYAFFESCVRERFPRHDILWAYTSRTLRAKMALDGIIWHSPEELLRDLPERGYGRAVIQSLHIVPGREFDKIVAAVAHAPLPATLGKPLLSCSADCMLVLDALAADIADPAECITVLAGHGSPSPEAQALYSTFARRVRKRYPENVHLCMVEAAPSWDETSRRLKESSLRRVRFVPFMFVSGDHIAHDVLGETDSWAVQLNGYEIEAMRTGLGFNRAIVDIYFEHLQNALNSFSWSG
jgi:sirohydrochlorin cobaltochelatase